jgi:hypothetical protein
VSCFRLSTSLRANGSRECAPDDRLREAIHLSLRCEMDCFVASAPLHKRFAFVAGNDDTQLSSRGSEAALRADPLARNDAEGAVAPPGG